MEGAKTDGEIVLVTGGSGFLGSWCLVELLRRGYQVRTTVRDLSREPEVRAMLAPEVEAGDRLSVLAADLTDDEGWDEAIEGCDYVLHVASPFPPQQPKDPDELIVPAREGALRVLRAGSEGRGEAHRAHLFRGGGRQQRQAARLRSAYRGGLERSCESRPQPLWPFQDDRGACGLGPRERERRDAGLTVIAPERDPRPCAERRSLVLAAGDRAAARTACRAYPELGFSLVDVRDVADLHIRAMTAPEAAGERFLGTGPFLWMAMSPRYCATGSAPRPPRFPPARCRTSSCGRWRGSIPGLRSVVGDLGRRRVFSSEKARTRLGWSPRPIEETIVDCAESLMRVGAVAAPATAPAA